MDDRELACLDSLSQVLQGFKDSVPQIEKSRKGQAHDQAFFSPQGRQAFTYPELFDAPDKPGWEMISSRVRTSG